jgi:hypothetical protein
MLYQVLLAVGGLGLLVQALLGFAQGDGDSGVGQHAPHSDPTPSHAGHEGHAWFLLLSPLRLFSVCLGVGGAGMLLQTIVRLSPWLVLALALLLGGAFYRFVVRPLMALVLRFASTPAITLSGAVGQEATADSRFDARGRGIVTLVVDGHLVRLLSTLDGPPQPIEAGETLVVIAIDAKRNTAKVAKL